MAASGSESAIGACTLHEVRDYERLRLPHRAIVALSAVGLLVNPADVLLWGGVLAVLISERWYRRSTYRLLGNPSTRGLSSVSLHAFRHQVLLVVLAVLNLASLVLGLLP